MRPPRPGPLGAVPGPARGGLCCRVACRRSPSRPPRSRPFALPRFGRGSCWISADGRSCLDGKRNRAAGGDVGGVRRLRHGVCQFPDYRAAVPGAEPALPGRHHNDDGRPNCCFYRTVCLGGHNVGHQGAVGEAQSALGYGGAWLLAALVCAMGSLLACWACRQLWKWRRNNADAG